MSDSKTAVLAQLEGQKFVGQVADGRMAFDPLPADALICDLNDKALETILFAMLFRGGRDAVVKALANLNRQWALEMQEAVARGVSDE